MPSETDIANAALRYLGADTITSFTQGTNEANAVNDLYSDLRDALLRAHNWNFATKKVALAESSTAPAYEFDNAFSLPSDWLRTVAVHDNDAGTGTFLYRMIQVGGQRVIETDVENVWLTYIARETDPNIMTADFRRLLAYTLASEMAVDLTSSNTLQDQLARKADRLMAQARSADGMGSFPRQRPRGSWASSRHGLQRWPD